MSGLYDIQQQIALILKTYMSNLKSEALLCLSLFVCLYDFMNFSFVNVVILVFPLNSDDLRN